MYVMLGAIWYYLYNLNNAKNTHGGVLFLVKLQAKSFLNYTNGIKSHNASLYFLSMLPFNEMDF